MTSIIVAKLLEVLGEAVPKADLIGLLVNPSGPVAAFYTVQAAADALGRKLLIVKASGASDFEMAFATLPQQRVGALLVPSDGLFMASIP